MELFKPFKPEIQKYFKISELAGKRWPNVTENEIYDWHDQGFGPPTGTDEKLVETISERVVYFTTQERDGAVYSFYNRLGLFFFYEKIDAIADNKWYMRRCFWEPLSL